jgi:RNA polymerase sigma-70 factor (ECF subfamily)
MSESPATRPSLLLRLRDPGDGRAWDEFTQIYGPLVRRLARRKGLQEADAADLEQEVFRAVSSAIDRWDPDPARGHFRGWLFRIARNILVDFLSRRRRHPPGTGDTVMKERLEAMPARAEDDSSLVEEEYKRELFRWAAEQIRGEFSEPTWRAFWLTGVEGRGAKEAAETLGMTAGAVYRCKSRVMARLREAVQRVVGEIDRPSG